MSHPGRTQFHGFGIFGGSNGYWRTKVLRNTRMHRDMLTEDIDSSMRVLAEGGRIASDPGLISRELAPVTLSALWDQRLRWAQGWFQVSLRHLGSLMRSPHLGVRQKAGLLYLLGWRELFPILSMQMFPIIIVWMIRFGGGQLVNWLVPIFVATTLFTLGTGPGQAIFAYRLADPSIRRHKRWFLTYILMSIVFYTRFKNTAALVAQLRQLAGQRQWRVTPRAAFPAAAPPDP